MSGVMQADGNEEHGARECPFFPSLASYLVLLSAIQVAVLAWSLAALRLTKPVAASILLVSLLAAWLVGRALNGGEAMVRLWAAISEYRRGRHIAAAFGVLFALLLVCATIVVDPSWDGNSYHLPAIQVWIQKGRIHWIEGLEISSVPLINGFPKTAEVLSFFLCTLLHPALSNTFNLFYFPLGILGIASIAFAFGATPGAALLAGAALLLVPINMDQSLTTYVDPAFGAAVIGWLAVIVRLRQLDRAWFVLQALVLGCALGQVIGTKGTGVPITAVGSLALVVLQLAARSAWLSKRFLAAWWLAVGICALPVGGFWYVRNLAHGLSPLYPIGVSVAGVTLFPGLDPYSLDGVYDTDGFIAGWWPPLQVAFTWMQGFSYWPQSIVGFDMRLGGLGFLWPLGCVPAVVALARRRIQAKTFWGNELVSQPLWLVLVVVSAGLVLMPCPWWSRLTIWIYGLGLPCLAAVSSSLTGRWGRRWIAACAAVALVEAGIVLARWQAPLLSVALRNNDKPPWVRVTMHFYPPWSLRKHVIKRILDCHDTIGVGSLDWYERPLLGVISEPVGARQIYFLPDDLENEFAAWYERVQPRYVMMNEHRTLPASAMAALQPEVYRTGSLTVLQFRQAVPLSPE